MTNSERDDLLDLLHKHRDLFRLTVAGLSDEQARATPTASTLCLGGLIKHVAATEKEWADFIVDGATTQGDVDWEGIDWSNPPTWAVDYQNQFRMLPGETLAGLLADYASVAATTDELVARVDLDARHPLPEAPWFEAGTSWSVRRTVMHIAVETAQHAGHADIIRESLDGQRSMG
ncbi:DinB family protein [Serinicoccus sp. LYQ131]|uniref:DinB family protein n=1 Tax=Serinicoccus sp. LYQ131 TaxID=3378797 RepID=UPI003853DAD0